MKFLQLATFYSHYLSQLYRSRPLAVLPYTEQLAAVLSDGLGAVHMLSDEMVRNGYEASTVIGNALSLQRQWALENDFSAPQGTDELIAITREQVERFRPDVLYLQDPIVFDGRFLRSLSWRPRLVLAWRAATIPQGTDWRGIDILLSSDAGCRATAIALGAGTALPFHPGFPAWIKSAIGCPTDGPDLVFSGSMSAEHGHRMALLAQVAEWARRRGAQARFHILRPDQIPPPELADMAHPQIFGIAMYRALASAKICLNTHIDVLGSRGQNMRIFETTGSGGLLLTEDDPNLSKLFQPDLEVVTYRDGNELLEKADRLLSSPLARATIAQRGHERCMRDHNRAGRGDFLDGLIRRTIGGGS